MAHSIFIDGAAGTTGLEIHQRLADRSEFDLIVLDDARRKDASARANALNTCDVAILCLPDDASREAVSMVEDTNTRIIDASSAHRVADGWTYGFPELVGRDAIAKAKRVSNPGCYPSGFLALVAPLVREGVIPADWPCTVHAVSGYSGGGKALIERFENGGDIAFRSYGLDLAHKHRLEMKKHAGLKHGVIFSPAVAAGYRGMMVEVPLHLGAMPDAPTADQLRDTLRRFYASSKVITVGDSADDGELLLRRDSRPDDSMTLYVFGNEGGYHARLVAVLDNLGKGASGAAVQSLNLMCGLPETSGLNLPK